MTVLEVGHVSAMTEEGSVGGGTTHSHEFPARAAPERLGLGAESPLHVETDVLRQRVSVCHRDSSRPPALRSLLPLN